MGDHTSDSNYAAWTGDRIMLCNLGIYDRIYTGRDHRFNDQDDHDAELYHSPIFYHGICRIIRDYGMEFARRIFSIQHFVWDIFENGAVRQRQRRKLEDMSFAKKHYSTDIF